MDEYLLFLDECMAIGPLRYFCLAGYIISREEYTNHMIPMVNALKQKTFGKTDIVFHEKDIRDLSGDFKCLSDKVARDSFWNGILSILKDSTISTVGAVVSTDIATIVYKSDFLNSNYSIALHSLLENYVYFLERNNAKGSVIIESTNETADGRLRNLYHTIISDGTLFINRNAFQKYLTTIAFHIKQDNNNGLQMADFIPNAVNRRISGLKPKPYSTIDIIEAKLYDGHVGMKERFGLKVIE